MLWDIAKLLISEAKTLSKLIEFLEIISKAVVSSTNLMRRCQWHRNLFVITAKTITPSFAPWSTPAFRVCQSDRVPPILTACYRLVRKAAIHFRRTGWISSLASSCISGVVNKMKSLCEISEEQSSRSLHYPPLHRQLAACTKGHLLSNTPCERFGDGRSCHPSSRGISLLQVKPSITFTAMYTWAKLVLDHFQWP